MVETFSASSLKMIFVLLAKTVVVLVQIVPVKI